MRRKKRKEFSCHIPLTKFKSKSSKQFKNRSVITSKIEEKIKYNPYNL